MASAMNAEMKKRKEDAVKKTLKLYTFLRELNELGTKHETHIKNEKRYFLLNELPKDSPYVKIYSRDFGWENNEDLAENEDTLLMEVGNPRHKSCPAPDDLIRPWLREGWENFKNEVALFHVNEMDEERKRLTHGQELTAHPQRSRLYSKWLAARNKWVEEAKEIEKIRNIFSNLFSWHREQERDSETVEVLVGNGFFEARYRETVSYPLLVKRVKISFDDKRNVMKVEDTDRPAELETRILRDFENEDFSKALRKEKEVESFALHPLDRKDTVDFLEELAHCIGPECVFVSENVEPSWRADEKFRVRINPVLVMRKASNSKVKAFNRIIRNIEQTKKVPQNLEDIVCGGLNRHANEPLREIPFTERLASVGGEAEDILLAKEANGEQLQIVRQIERYDGLVVQGPPGTGKTHTIANLMGHFLANGKTVLVTSQKSKALNVLKEKLVPEMQDLCVSVLDGTHADMKKSVQGITDAMGRETPEKLRAEIKLVKKRREEIIESLRVTREKIFQLRQKNAKHIVIGGEEISVNEAADFVRKNSATLAYIPGQITAGIALPLTVKEIQDLYVTNEEVSAKDEAEFQKGVPDPEDFLLPEIFATACAEEKKLQGYIQSHQQVGDWTFNHNMVKGYLACTSGTHRFDVPIQAGANFDELKEYIAAFKDMEKWMINAVVDGKRGMGKKGVWEDLIERLKDTQKYAEESYEKFFGKDVVFLDLEKAQAHLEDYEKLAALYEQGKSLGLLTRWRNPGFKEAQAVATVDGKPPETAEACQAIVVQLTLLVKRNECATYWDKLMAVAGVTPFYELDREEPERVAAKRIPQILAMLVWYDEKYGRLQELLHTYFGEAGTNIFAIDNEDNDESEVRKILYGIRDSIATVIDMCEKCVAICENKALIKDLSDRLNAEKNRTSELCVTMRQAVNNRQPSVYSKAYDDLCELRNKNEILVKRSELLEKLAKVAPDWARAIRRREGIHGNKMAPEHLREAWLWKQYDMVISDLVGTSYADLEKESRMLSRQYRKETANLAVKQAWFHMLTRIQGNLSMKQNLQGWVNTVSKIGKGTGKSAPRLRAEAREKMARCQTAVPAWIMPMNDVLDNMVPGKNEFDVLIVDEASQSSVTALAVFALAKKVIIVGDDAQVSPDAINIKDDQVQDLQKQYIRGEIVNANDYTPDTSLYDIAKTTFYDLMLHEHFRCVPDIIGYSNQLSYHNKIKPLRDNSQSNLLPAVVNYRVQGKRGSDKKNLIEAEWIIALMKACMEQPEYAKKTFGVISLLGEEQALYIEQTLTRYIDKSEIETRRILCGNSANFQGDERDVVFLSMVDSGTGDGPLGLRGVGRNEMYKKRYNVAASRAKDQLWVVHSLDYATDLKPGDLRRGLLEYADKVSASREQMERVRSVADSPFETEVAEFLTNNGYRVTPQWQAGAYRIDMVVSYRNKRIALECDGDQYHSSDEQLMNDMERQIILERVGWEFIRIRGGEFYRDKEGTMLRVFEELERRGIHPDLQGDAATANGKSDLFDRVRARAEALVAEWDKTSGLTDEELEYIGSMAELDEPETVVNVEAAERKKDEADAQPREAAQPSTKRGKQAEQRVNSSSQQAAKPAKKKPQAAGKPPKKAARGKGYSGQVREDRPSYDEKRPSPKKTGLWVDIEDYHKPAKAKAANPQSRNQNAGKTDSGLNSSGSKHSIKRTIEINKSKKPKKKIVVNKKGDEKDDPFNWYTKK